MIPKTNDGGAQGPRKEKRRTPPSFRLSCYSRQQEVTTDPPPPLPLLPLPPPTHFLFPANRKKQKKEKNLYVYCSDWRRRSNFFYRKPGVGPRTFFHPPPFPRFYSGSSSSSSYFPAPDHLSSSFSFSFFCRGDIFHQILLLATSPPLSSEER